MLRFFGDDGMQNNLWWRISILLLCLFIGIIYLLTMAPGLTWANRGADGGDLITAAATGGVPHPSGYPTYLLIARLFQFLPLRSLAFRTNLMSAVFALMTVLLVTKIVPRSFTGSSAIGRTAGLITGLGFGLSPLLWSQAVITEVYTLHAFLVALILWLMPLSGEGPLNELWRDRLGGLIFGLAIGNQLTVLFLLPFYLLVGSFPQIIGETVTAQPGNGLSRKKGLRPLRTPFFRVIPRLAELLHLILQRVKWRSLARRLGWLLLGLSSYLIILLRAHSGSPVNWGNPTNWKGLWWLISGEMYQERVFHLGLEYAWPRMRTWAGMLQSQFGLPGLAIGFFGLLFGQPVGKRFYPLTVWMLAAYSIFAIGYDSSDSYTLLLPAFLAFALWFGIGCAVIIAIISKARWSAWLVPVGIGILLLMITNNAAVHYDSVDASDSNLAEVFVDKVFSAAPEGAVLLTQEDRDTFTLWYYHFALEERTDLAVIAQPLLNYDWYQTTLDHVYPDLLLPDIEAGFSPEIIAELNERIVCRVELGADEYNCLTCETSNGISDSLGCSP